MGGIDQDTDTEMNFGVEHIRHIVRTSAVHLKTLSMSGCYFTEDEDHPLELYPGSNTTTLVTLSRKLETLSIHAVLNRPRDWEVYSWILASTSLPASAKLLVSTVTTGGEITPDSDTIRTVIKDCIIQTSKRCNLDVLAIGDEPLLMHPVEDYAYFTFAFYPEAIGPSTSLLGAQDADTLMQGPLLIVCEYWDKSDYDIGLEYLDALIEAASVRSQFTTIAYLARSMFFDSKMYMATFRSLCAGTDVRTFAIRAVDLERFDDVDDPMQDWRYLTDVLRGPVLPRLQHLTLHDVVDLARIPDILRSRVRSLSETGHPAWKLRELRLNVVGKSGEVPSEHDEDDTALIATFSEFADSVILSRV